MLPVLQDTCHHGNGATLFPPASLHPEFLSWGLPKWRVQPTRSDAVPGARPRRKRETGKSTIRELEKKIESEESRLELVEERLVARFARLERVLTEMQQQMSAVNMLTQAVFGAL